MKKSRFSEEQIVTALKQVDLGVAVEEVCRKYGISQQTYYRWQLPFIAYEPTTQKTTINGNKMLRGIFTRTVPARIASRPIGIKIKFASTNVT